MKIKISKNYHLTFLDYPNYSEWSTSLYMIGCDHKCKGCHNPLLQDVNYSDYVLFENIDNFGIFLKKLVKYNRSKNFNILGGEPLAPWNIEQTKLILSHFGNIYNFCIYTGYTLDYVTQNNIYGFKYIKTGKYIQELHNNVKCDKFILGSTNQKLWDANLNLLTDNGVLSKKIIEVK